MSDTALLVIDVQHSFHHTRYWDASEFEAYGQRQNHLIAAARRYGWPVVHIYHHSAQGPFAPANGLVRAMDFVDKREEDPVFNKHVHNALTESGLRPWLETQGIERLVVSGIRTEQCCETTARVASDLGYAVEFALDATLTFPMAHPQSGERVSPAQIRAHTALVLADRFARITRVADYDAPR